MASFSSSSVSRESSLSRNVKHEGTLNRTTSLAEIWGGGRGKGQGSFSMKDEGPRLSARLLNRAIVRFLLFLWVLLLQTLPSSGGAIQGWKIPLRLLDIPRLFVTYGDLSSRASRKKQYECGKKRKRKRGGKKVDPQPWNICSSLTLN